MKNLWSIVKAVFFAAIVMVWFGYVTTNVAAQYSSFEVLQHQLLTGELISFQESEYVNTQGWHHPESIGTLHSGTVITMENVEISRINNGVKDAIVITVTEGISVTKYEIRPPAAENLKWIVRDYRNYYENIRWFEVPYEPSVDSNITVTLNGPDYIGENSGGYDMWLKAYGETVIPNEELRWDVGYNSKIAGQRPFLYPSEFTYRLPSHNGDLYFQARALSPEGLYSNVVTRTVRVITNTFVAKTVLLNQPTVGQTATIGVNVVSFPTVNGNELQCESIDVRLTVWNDITDEFHQHVGDLYISQPGFWNVAQYVTCNHKSSGDWYAFTHRSEVEFCIEDADPETTLCGPTSVKIQKIETEGNESENGFVEAILLILLFVAFAAITAVCYAAADTEVIKKE